MIGSCSSTKKFNGFSYDPEGSTITKDKEVHPQHKRTIGIRKEGIWVSNEFPGARMSDFYQVSDSLYRVVVDPENYPINDSPWYSFKIWSDTTRSINLQLTYNHGNHRYKPKLSHDRTHWQTIDSTNYKPDTLEGTATLTLDIGKDTLWVSAQELFTESDFERWADSLALKPSVSLDTVGYTHDRNPIVKMSISDSNGAQQRGVLIITGRLHPPEVTGELACKYFIEELTANTRLASLFRQEFEIWAYPFANPDGVQRGNWRGNGAGVDLNRDWQHFNQPETYAIKNDLLTLKKDPLRKVYYGIDFHSTDENIFYPIDRDISTFPEDFTYTWIDSLEKKFPHYPWEVEPFDASSPITKNWIYHSFGADAVTYEISDTANRDSLRTITKENARIIMRRLLIQKSVQR
jgi:predicted deacylase